MLTSISAALDINSSTPLNYFNDGEMEFQVDTNGTVHGFGNFDLGGNSLTGIGGTQCPKGEALLGDGSCGATSDPQNLSQVLTQGESTEGNDISVDNSNITSSDGNVSIGTDLKIYGDVWIPESSDFSGGRNSQNLSTVLEEGSSTGNFNIDMNGNNLLNFFQDTACPSGETMTGVNNDGTYQCTNIANEVTDSYVNRSGDTMEGDLDMNDNNITDSKGTLCLGDEC